MKDLLDNINKVWYVGALIISLVVGWTTFKTTIDNQEKRLTVLESHDSQVGDSLEQIRLDIAIIKTKLSQ